MKIEIDETTRMNFMLSNAQVIDALLNYVYTHPQKQVDENVYSFIGDLLGGGKLENRSTRVFIFRDSRELQTGLELFVEVKKYRGSVPNGENKKTEEKGKNEIEDIAESCDNNKSH